jgi:histidinol-phosphate aminotransferase
LRVGYSVSSSELCDLFNRVRQPFNGNSLGLAAAQAALEDDDFVAQSRASIPSAGNFLTVRFGANSPQIYQQLLQRGVIVRPVANYGLPEHLRISVGTEPQLQLVLGEIL